MEKGKAKSIESIYSQRDKFVLIGLTGRTGAGCTTVSSILSKDDMKDLDLRSYKTCDFNNSDERKYSIVYRFMKEGKRWKKFEVIEASSIIFSFIIEETYNKLFEYMDKLNREVDIKEIDELKKEIVYELAGENNTIAKEQIELSKYKDIGEPINKKASEYIKKISDDSLINTCREEELNDIIDFFTKEIVELKTKFRNVLK